MSKFLKVSVEKSQVNYVNVEQVISLEYYSNQLKLYMSDGSKLVILPCSRKAVLTALGIERSTL